MTHPVDDRVDCDSVGVAAGNVMTDVCVKTWPSDVWTTKEMLEVKEGLEAEEVEEEVLGGVVGEDVAPAELDVAAFEGAFEVGLAAAVEELAGAAEVCGAVVCGACEVGVGLAVVGVALGSGEVVGVATGA